MAEQLHELMTIVSIFSMGYVLMGLITNIQTIRAGKISYNRRMLIGKYLAMFVIGLSVTVMFFVKFFLQDFPFIAIAGWAGLAWGVLHSAQQSAEITELKIENAKLQIELKHALLKIAELQKLP